MENLAPAGNWDALRSAVAAGADAVYLGYAAYSARAGAGNFDEQQLRDAVRFAHLHHVRVHVTVNTLIKDGEMAGVVDVLIEGKAVGKVPVVYGATIEQTQPEEKSFWQKLFHRGSG